MLCLCQTIVLYIILQYLLTECKYNFTYHNSDTFHLDLCGNQFRAVVEFICKHLILHSDIFVYVIVSNLPFTHEPRKGRNYGGYSKYTCIR